MKQSIKTIILKRLTFTAFFVIALIVFLVAYNFRELTISAMKDKGAVVANFVEVSLISHMNVSSKEQKQQFIRDIQKISGIENLKIIHSEEVASQYNLQSHKQFLEDSTIARVFKEKQPSFEFAKLASNEDMMRITFPYISQFKNGVNCAKCHTNENQSVLGVVDFYVDMSQYKSMSIGYLYIVLLLLGVVLGLILLAMFNIIDRHIKEPLDILMDDTKKSYETNKPIKLNEFESYELQDMAYKINLFNEEVLEQHKALKEKNEELIALNAEIEATQKEVISVMANVAESRSKETANHIQRVAEFSYLFAKKIGLEENEALLLKDASSMHDVGKVGIADDILHKPSKLNDEEFEQMKTHTSIGYEIFKNSKRKLLQAAAIVAHEHHERFDGKGYPRGLLGEKIHIFGRIVAVADVFDALSSPRIYKSAWSKNEVKKFFENDHAEQFDPTVVNILLSNFDEFWGIRENLFLNT